MSEKKDIVCNHLKSDNREQYDLREAVLEKKNPEPSNSTTSLPLRMTHQLIHDVQQCCFSPSENCDKE